MKRHRELQRAWLRFDRSTAYQCVARKVPFDVERCREAWLHWCEVAGQDFQWPIGLEAT